MNRITCPSCYGTTNLVIATNNGVNLALLGTLGQVDGVLLECLTLLFCVGVGDRTATNTSDEMY